MRFHYLDAMRSILMILGVLLHTANVYAVRGHWQIHDPQTHVVFDSVSEFIHIFRMPALFLISGFFAQMTFEKYGHLSFLQLRFRRLLIPLLSTAVLCNTLQIWLHVPEGCTSSDNLYDFMTVTMPCAIQRGAWVQHLWFLIVVMVYCICCLPLAAWLKHRRMGVEAASENQFSFNKALLFSVPFITVLISVIQHFVPVLQGEGGPFFFGLVDPAYLLGYLPFFAFGMWLYTDPAGLSGFCQFGPISVAAIIAAFSLQQIVQSASDGISIQVLSVYLNSLEQWLGCHLCFCVFQRFFRQPSRFFSYLADASYSIYLFHHLAIVAVSGLLVHVTTSVFLKFSVVIFLAGLLTLAMHELFIRRVPLLRLLFNGK